MVAARPGNAHLHVETMGHLTGAGNIFIFHCCACADALNSFSCLACQSEIYPDPRNARISGKPDSAINTQRKILAAESLSSP